MQQEFGKNSTDSLFALAAGGLLHDSIAFYGSRIQQEPIDDPDLLHVETIIDQRSYQPFAVEMIYVPATDAVVSAAPDIAMIKAINVKKD